jgi:hypothetical protein
MAIFLTVLVFVFVVGVLAVVGYALYESTPLPRRANPYRDSLTGQRRFPSPHLEPTPHDPD